MHRHKKRTLASAIAVALIAMLAPAASQAAGACGVLTDASGDVAGPLGTPRAFDAAGASIDLTGVTMRSRPADVLVDFKVRDLSAKATASTSGAFYTAFWTYNGLRYFAQAARTAGSYTYTAGLAAAAEPTSTVEGTQDTIPQQGEIVDGDAFSKTNTVRVIVARERIGNPPSRALLQQVRAGAQESSWQAVTDASGAPHTQHMGATNDRAGGPEGARYLMDRACLPALSGTGERCVVVTDSPHDARTGLAGQATSGTEAEVATRSTASGAVDPATEILSVQMGSNGGTIVVELAVAGLDNPIPEGAEAQRWDVSWTSGLAEFFAVAERRTTGPTFWYGSGSQRFAATGSLDTTGGTIRILVPRYEVRAEGFSRLTRIFAQSSLVTGTLTDVRDAAPDRETFASQFVSGASCAEQEKAACPVVLDPLDDAGFYDQGAPKSQPASDMSAAGISAPAGSLVVTARVADIGAGPPEGFQVQGWTLSWTFNNVRYFGQAERGEEFVIFRYGALGSADQFQAPSGPSFRGAAAEGVFDVQAGVVRIAMPREGVGSPGNGAMLVDVAAQSWIMKDAYVAGAGTSSHVPVDNTPVAPYRVGLSCGA